MIINHHQYTIGFNTFFKLAIYLSNCSYPWSIDDMKKFKTIALIQVKFTIWIYRNS